ncbi:MAG TPA: hypothetical protein VK699_10595 [Terriglobales bacterium]|jgi:hypothetical protein|nr:hypothetical protein [Terriglobales bacterium]
MMPTRNRFYYKTLIRRHWRGIYLLLLLFSVLSPGWLRAQGTAPATRPESKLSKKEADELFRSLDDILRFASEDTNLPIRHKVKRELSSRDQVAQNLNERMKDDEDAKRLQRSELVLKKFGFLPRSFDLPTYLVSLMREQVAGYYNVKDKTVYLMDWIPSEQQKPVMAHELTHALQDQNFDLKKWLAGDAEEEAKKAGQRLDQDAEDIASDEQQTARQALVEGQGMAVLIDYMLKDSGLTVSTAPSFVEALKQNISDGSDSPIYSNAPLYMRESLGFPYRYGLSFVQALLSKGGKDMAYAGAMKRPPRSSHDIMSPEGYLAGEVLEPLALPHMTEVLGKDYERYDVGSVGQFDVMVLLKQFTSDKLGEKLAPGWRGGAYYAALKHGIPEEKSLAADKDADKSSEKVKTEKKDAEPVTTKSLALLYLSRWSSPGIAVQFAQAYNSMLLKRYRFVDPKEPDEPETTDAKADAAAKNIKPDPVAGHDSICHWTTDEGSVTVEQHGDTVLVLESFDAKTQAALSKAVWQAAAQPSNVAIK